MRPFKIERDDDGRMVVEFEEKLSSCLSVASQTSAPVADVLGGDWLYHFFPAWNVHDFYPTMYAADIAEGGRFDARFAVQIYSDLSEVVTWLLNAGVAAAEAEAVGGPLLTTRVSGEDGGPKTLHIGSDPAKTLVWVAMRDGVVREVRQGVRTPEDIKAMIAEMFPAGR